MIDNINQHHIIKAIEYCLANNVPVTYEILILVDNTYKNTIKINAPIGNKIESTITHLEHMVKTYEDDPRWQMGNNLFHFTQELSKYLENFKDCLQFININKTFKL